FHTVSHVHTHTNCFTLFHMYTHTHTHTNCFTLFHMYTHTHTHTNCFTLFHMYTHTHTHTNCFTLFHMYTHTHTLTKTMSSCTTSLNHHHTHGICVLVQKRSDFWLINDPCRTYGQTEKKRLKHNS